MLKSFLPHTTTAWTIFNVLTELTPQAFEVFPETYLLPMFISDLLFTVRSRANPFFFTNKVKNQEVEYN